MWFRRVLLIGFLLLCLNDRVMAQTAPGAALQVTSFFGGSFKPGKWLPLRVTASNDGPDLRATLRIGNTTGATYDTALELPRGARKVVVVYVQPESFAHSVRVRLLDGERELTSTDVKVSSWVSPTDVVGELTERPITAPQPTPSSRQLRLATFPLQPDELPARPEGLSSLDALIVDGNMLDGLEADQAQAIDDWVRMGGQLVVGAGGDAAILQKLPPALRIATAGTSAKQPVADTLLSELGADAQIMATALTPVASATQPDALTVQRDWGRGRVTIIGFSLSEPTLQQLPRDTQLWSTLLRLRQFDPNVPPDMTMDDIQAQQITQALYNLPSLTLPPLKVLVILLVLYILLVGPVLYFVLRRLDRQAWAWGAIPALTLLFSGGAYGYGLRIRGDDIILNQINLVQPLGDRARVRSFAGIFSPTERSYDISIDGDVLTHPLQFDPKMMGGSAQGVARAHYQQGTGGIRDLHVDQWAMSTFAVETQLPINPLVATLELGDARLQGTVRNAGNSLIRDVAVVQGNNLQLLGDLAPGVEKPVALQLTNNPNMGGESLAMRIFKSRWNPNSGPEPEVRIPVQLIDSLYGYAPWARPTSPSVLGWLDANPLPMQVSSGRLHHQQLTLVEVSVDVHYGPTVTFPRGWARAEWETTRPDQGSCMTQWAAGTMLTSDILTATLRLPLEVKQLQITQAAIITQVEGPTLDRVVVEVYDWRAGAWTRQAEAPGSADLSEPDRFFHNGELRARLSVGPGGVKGGCVSLDLSAGGRQ